MLPVWLMYFFLQNDGSVEDLRQTGKNKSKVLSVIDGRRAQNCTILLSKLKMSDEEIARTILDMDTKDVLPLDMVEQLLKFTPGPDEAALLEEHSDDLCSLARADRFLYEISKFVFYTKITLMLGIIDFIFFFTGLHIMSNVLIV